MERFAARLDASNEVLAQFMSFAKKAMDEINRLHQNSQPNLNTAEPDEEIDEGEVEKYVFSGVNLLALGGTT